MHQTCGWQITLLTCNPVEQVYSWGRQLLSLFAGGAIDDFVLSHLRMLRQEHFLARKILQLQALLWPGGVWFMSALWHAVRRSEWSHLCPA